MRFGVLAALCCASCTLSFGQPNEESQPASALAMLERSVNEIQAELVALGERSPCPEKEFKWQRRK